MFIVAFGRDGFRWDDDFGHCLNVVETSPGSCKLAKSLEEAREKRMVSGDLVFHAETLEIVQDDSWLFEWEKDKEKCYAKTSRQLKVKLVIDDSWGDEAYLRENGYLYGVNFFG